MDKVFDIYMVIFITICFYFILMIIGYATGIVAEFKKKQFSSLFKIGLCTIIPILSYNFLTDKPKSESSVQAFIDDDASDSEKNETYEMVAKIKSHKTTRSYSDGFNSTPIYSDDNGRDYIIVRTPSSAKIVHLNGGREVILNQGVAILLDF